MARIERINGTNRSNDPVALPPKEVQFQLPHSLGNEHMSNEEIEGIKYK